MSNKPLYDFRLRFNFPDQYRIQSEDSELELFTSIHDKNIKLFSGNPSIPIKECARLAIIGEQYSTKVEAMLAAEKSKQALLIWAVVHRVGISFGDGKQRSSTTKEGLEIFQKIHSCTVMNDMLGIDVYEHITPVKFVSFEVNPQLGKYAPVLIDTFKQEYSVERQFSDQYILACEIYTSSFFDTSPRSRFITLVTVVEALINPSKHKDNIQLLIDKWLEMLKQEVEDPKDRDDKDSLMGSLYRLKYQSINQAGQKLANDLLPKELFDGMPSGKFFKYCYDLRCQIVHNGHLENNSIHILDIANKTEQFVNKLLTSALSSIK